MYLSAKVRHEAQAGELGHLNRCLKSFPKSGFCEFMLLILLSTHSAGAETPAKATSVASINPECQQLSFTWLGRNTQLHGDESRLAIATKTFDTFNLSVYSSGNGFKHPVRHETFTLANPKLQIRDSDTASLWISPDERSYVLLLATPLTDRPASCDCYLIGTFGGDQTVINGPGGAPFWGRQPRWGEIMMWPCGLITDVFTSQSPKGGLLGKVAYGRKNAIHPDSLTTINLNTGALTILYDGGPESLFPAPPIWSPDGRFIAAQLWGESALIVADVTDGGRLKVKSPSPTLWNPEWADATHISFQVGSELYMTPGVATFGNHTHTHAIERSNLIFSGIAPDEASTFSGFSRVLWSIGSTYFAFKDHTTVNVLKLKEN